MNARRTIRVGAVSYLNTKPLVWRLNELAPHAEVIYDLPSRLADGLAAGRFDVALIPSLEFLQNPEYRIVSSACIGCRGPVLSVKLLGRRPLSETRVLALDEGSRTSVALSQILLERRFGLRPRLVPFPIGTRLEDVEADAVLLIGDRAIWPPKDRFVEVWDLGQQWRRWAGLPFVFAVWTAKADADLQGVDAALSQARDEGVRRLDVIAEREAAAVNLTVEQCKAYLAESLHFYLGAQELRGLKMFCQQAARLGLAPVRDLSPATISEKMEAVELSDCGEM